MHNLGTSVLCGQLYLPHSNDIDQSEILIENSLLQIQLSHQNQMLKILNLKYIKTTIDMKNICGGLADILYQTVKE